MSLTIGAPARHETRSRAASSGFIIGPVADSLLIIGAPLLALLIAAPLYRAPASAFRYPILAAEQDLRQVFALSFTFAHLFLVYFRSHVNLNIFKLYPLRFTVVPAVLLLACALNLWVAGVVGVISIWWDVYHSGLQTFGFGRIYDAKQKNNPVAGRRLDYWMNLVLYVGPVLAGAHFVDHLSSAWAKVEFLPVQQNVLTDLLLVQGPGYLQTHQEVLSLAVLGIGALFIVYYLYAYHRLQQQGYHVSWQKVWLLAITGCVSIYSWGFRTFIDAFWTMNVFHALQYFAIVLFTEEQNLTRFFRLDRFSFGRVLTSVWVVAICFLYGFWAAYYATGRWMMSLVLTTSIMHFWYDGFIWSVRKKQV